MTSFSTAREAKECLVSRIVAEAKSENVSLSETERKMLYFSETGWTLPDIMEVNDKFHRECDRTEYENKIARLIRTATHRARQTSPQDFASWMSAIRKLKKEDHYISVMVAAAGVSTGSRTNNWKVVAQAVIIIAVPLLALSFANHFGLLTSRSGQRYGNTSTTDERFTSRLGYAVISFLAFGLLVSVYSHFDRKGRINEIFGRIVTRVLRLFGASKDV
jgi:hypothetical protein